MLQADPDLKAELAKLLADYRMAAGTDAPTYNANLTGSGAIAQGDGATAIGERGVNIKGRSSGPIVTGSGNTINYGGGSVQVAANLPSNLTAVRDNLIEFFNKSELQGLAFEMGIRSDDLPGQTISELAQSLVIYCNQRGRLMELVQIGRRERPHLRW